MAKALKFAAIAVGAVALAFTGVGLAAGLGAAATSFGVGVSASTLFLVSGGLSIAAGLLQKGPKVTASQTDRLSANIDPRTFRKTVLGQTAMPVDVRYEEWSGKDQEICEWIVAFASHAIDGLEEIWFDTEMAWSAATGVVAKYNGYFSIPNLILEGTPQNAFSFGQWSRDSARLTGCAYARFRFKVTGNSKKAESPFSSGIPSRITVIGRGAKLYDPRRDSTVPGGSGPMRWDDQSTWRFTTDDGVVIGENLPLQILRVILGWRIRNPSSGEMKLATGAGVPGRRISFPSFQVAANLADELVNRAAGGNEPRYHGAGVVSEGDDQKTVLDMLCSACCGRFRDTGGKLALAISHNDLAAAAVDDGLNDDDVVGAFTWDPDPSLETTPNVVRGRYVDATSASLYQLIDYPEVRLPSPDGQDRFLSLDLGVVESPSQAQRIAKQVLQRRQYSRQFAAPFDIRAWKYTVGDVLPFTFAPLGFQRGVFRVKEQELGQGGTCNMVLTFETPAFYQWDADDSLPVQGAEPIVYDRGNNPLILAIDEAATTAFWNGVTGDGKPEDDATNSADPNSAFGPGTVGGTITKISEFDVQLAAAKAQVDAINNQTIPAVNQAVAVANDQIAAARSAAEAAVAAARKSADDAVAEANAKLAAARSDIDRAQIDLAAEVSRAKGKDEDLTQRIDAISAGNGYDDTQIRALIQTVDTARADDKRAIASRVDSIVTDYQNRDTATNARISQDFTTFTNADRALGSRIDSVITNYRGLDSNTNSRITSSVASLSDADRALGQRIDALVVEGGGYDDSYVRADITTNNTAAINRDLALGQRIDIVSASFSRGGGNLLSNSDFVSTDGWAIVNTLPGAEPLSLNSNGTPYMVGGIENNLSVHQNGRADGGDGAFVRIASDAFGVIPGAFLQFYAFTAAHRSQAWVSIFFYGEDGSLAGDGGQNYGPRTGNGGHDGSGWDQVGVKSIRVPDAARTARLILQKFNTATGQTDSVAWFWHAYVGEARDGQSVWNAYTSGNGKAVQVRSDARISQASTAAASATQAVADLSTSVTTQLLGIGNSLSAYDSRIIALSTDQQSTAGAVTSIRASLTRSGGNLISNTDFVTTDGWAVNRFEPNGAMALTPGIDAAGATYHPAGEHVISIVQGARTGGDAYAEWESQPFGVSPTEWIQYYAFYNAHRCDVMVGIIWRNQAGTPVGSANSGRKTALNVDGNNPQNYVQIGAVVAQVPANAVSATIVLRKYDTYLNQTSSYAWFWRAYAGQVSAGQSAWNAYVAGSARAVQARSDAAIVQASTAAATANQSVADLTTSVNARFVGVNTTLTSYDSRISALSTDTQGYAGRTSTLEAQMSRSAPSALQQLTLDVNSNLIKVNDNLNLVNTQVNARIKSSEDVIADLPNRYAAASRTAALEASVNGDGNSRLLARANDQAAVIADAKVGVVTSSLSTLRSDFNGVSATVQQQAGTIASVNGRSQVYWGVTGTTPDGFTTVQLSKADGSPGLFYVGANMLVSGNLTVDGTITARKFDRSSMSREGSATWTGSITPDIGQTITVPWGLSLSQVPALGRFVYEIQVGVTTNAGQQQVSQMNGKPAYLTFVEAGGGLNIAAVDNQGNVYRPAANSWTVILATTDFVPSWTATIARGSYDTGWVNQGDSYERQVAAIYSVSSIRMKVMWVAI
jgi:hypothetical protein